MSIKAEGIDITVGDPPVSIKSMCTITHDDEKAAIIANKVWEWINKHNALDLVPWISDPKSNRYDAIKTAKHDGYKQCLSDLKQYIKDIAIKL